MFSWLRKLLCKHDYHHIRNIYGDEINTANCRSVWMCNKCYKWDYRHYLYHGNR